MPCGKAYAWKSAMNLFTDFDARIKTALEQIDLVKEKRSEVDFGRIAIEPPRDPSHDVRRERHELAVPLI